MLLLMPFAFVGAVGLIDVFVMHGQLGVSLAKLVGW